jgi:exosortase N
MTIIDRNTLFLIGFYTIITAFTLRDYLIVDATFVVGLAVLLFNFNNCDKTRIVSFRYLFWVLPTLILAVLTNTFSFFYLASVGAVMVIWESRIGKLSALPPILVLIISPIFRYVTDVFTFDFRLKLTEIAAFVLQKIDHSPIVSGFRTSTVSAVGNLIKLKDGSEWQIDEACMGLNMLGVSLILSIFFIAYFADRLKTRVLLRGVVLLLVIALVLNIFCNLLRIIALVHFRVLPHTAGHDMVGLLALAIYVVVPMFFLIKKTAQYDWFFSNKNVHQHTSPKVHPEHSVWKGIAVNTIILLILLTKSAFLIYKKPDATTDTPPNISLKGFEKRVLSNGICQLSNDSLLIYIKPLKSFYTTEHSPMICWKGSGFVFKKIEKTKVGNDEIYTGILAKGDSTIHAAWWFENERGERTIDQMTWRWAAFTEGGHFRLVNANATKLIDLQQFMKNY